jgi:hypothetical protein
MLQRCTVHYRTISRINGESQSRSNYERVAYQKRLLFGWDAVPAGLPRIMGSHVQSADKKGKIAVPAGLPQ